MHEDSRTPLRPRTFRRSGRPRLLAELVIDEDLPGTVYVIYIYIYIYIYILYYIYIYICFIYLFIYIYI